MSIQRNYCKAVAAEMNRHAVWPPGSPTNIGDYGLLDDGTFLKLGTIDEFFLSEKVQIERSTPSTLEFTSVGTKVLLSDAKAQMTASSQLAPVTASAELLIRFEHANSIYLRAAKVVTEEITNIEGIARLLREVPRWQFRWVVISKVATASSSSLILSAGERAEVSVQATTDILKAFDAGNVGAKLRISIAGDAALKIIGASGPLLFDAIRLRRILGGVRRGARPGGLAMKPHEIVLPGESDNSSPLASNEFR